MKRLHVIGALCMLLLAACGIEEDSWAGVSPAEEDRIFVSYNHSIIKLNALGEELWTYPDRDERDGDFFANVVYDDENAYVGDYLGNVHRIDLDNGEGEVIHKVSGTRLFGLINFGGSTDRVIGAIAIGERLLYIPDEEGVFAIDLETQERDDDWMLETDRAVWSQPLYVPASEDAAARLFVTALDHVLYAVDAETAEELWSRDLEGAVPGQPVLATINEREVLFVGTFGSEMLAVDAQTGEVIDRYESDGWIWESPNWVDDTLYFGDLNGFLYSLTFEEDEFQRQWETRLTEDGKLRATPLVTDNLVVIGSDDGFVYAVDRASGDNEWSEEVEHEVVSPLVLVENEEGGSLIVTATDETDTLVIALELDGGRQYTDNDWPYEFD